MAAPDPYFGTTGAFSFSDYREAVSARHTGGASTFTRGRAEASWVWIVDERKEAAAIRYGLGYDSVTTTAPYTLLRKNPVLYPRPGYTALFCTGVSSEPFIPDPVVLKRQNLGLPLNQLANYYAGYKKVRLTLHMEPLLYDVIEDDGIPNYYSEYLRNTTFNLEPRTETLNLDNVFTFSEGSGNSGPVSNPQGQQFAAPYAQVLVKPDITVVWHNVPSSYVETPVFYPTHLLNGLGKVNSRDWYSKTDSVSTYFYPAGTLLCMGAKITREPNAHYTNTTMTGSGVTPSALESKWNLRVELMFSYFDPPKGLNSGVTITTNRGHNNGPWAGGRNATTGLIVSGDTNAGRWFLFTRGGGANDNRLLQSYNFDNFFNCCLNPAVP